MFPADTIVGYAYNTEIYCVHDMEKWAEHMLIAQGDAFAWGDSGDAEDRLNALAPYLDIDRSDESGFDSDDFPKVIFASSDDAESHCDKCGSKLMEAY